MKQQILTLSILTLASSLAFAGGAGETTYSYECYSPSAKVEVNISFKHDDPIHVGSDAYLFVDGKIVRLLKVTVNYPRLIRSESTHDETKPDIKADFIFAKETDNDPSIMRIQTGDQAQEYTDIKCISF